jgi:hypothetical protein
MDLYLRSEFAMMGMEMDNDVVARLEAVFPEVGFQQRCDVRYLK